VAGPWKYFLEADPWFLKVEAAESHFFLW
jgi:hypothetical protein